MLPVLKIKQSLKKHFFELNSQEDEVLKATLSEEFQQMNNNEAGFMEIYNAFFVEKDAHVNSREGFYKTQIYMKFILENIKQKRIADGTYDAEKDDIYQDLFKDRIIAVFTIDKEGVVTNIRARAPHPDLEVEAVRVLSSLPLMTPGKQKGIAANVSYSLPIVFQVNEYTSFFILLAVRAGAKTPALSFSTHILLSQ